MGETPANANGKENSARLKADEVLDRLLQAAGLATRGRTAA
jgi:hypothetical protein